MARTITIPIYPHTSDEEIAEILETLERVGIDDAQVVHAYAPDETLERLAQPGAAVLEFRRGAVKRPDRFRDHAEEIGYVHAVELLRRDTEAIAGRPGWRVDRDGREWYSADWL